MNDRIWFPHFNPSTTVGVGDRVRGLTCALVLLRSLGRKSLLARWIPNWACAAKFTDLFHTIDDVAFFEAETLADLPEIPLSAQLWTFEGNIVPEAALHRFRHLHPPGHPSFASLEAFYAAWAGVLRSFRPLPHVQERIDAASAEFAMRMVTVHLRRTDVMFDVNKPINHLNVEHYDAALWAEVERLHVALPEAEFFLTADREDYLDLWQAMMVVRGLKVHV